MKNNVSANQNKLLFLSALLALGLGAVGCREASEPAPPWEVHQPVREHIEGLRQTLDGPLRQAAEARVGAAAMQELLAKQASRPWRDRVKDGIKYADLFQKLYEERKWHKVAVTSQGLLPAGQEALRHVRGYKHHLISEPKSYHLASVDKKLAAFNERKKVAWKPVVLTGEQVNVLVKWAKEKGLDPAKKEQMNEAIVEAVLSTEQGVSPLPKLSKSLAAYGEQTAASAAQLASLELHIMDGVLRYARDMRLFNLNRLSWGDLKSQGGSKAIIYGRLGEFFGALAKATDVPSANKMMGRLMPPHPQYQKMLAFRSHYARLVKQGGWKSVGPVSLRLGVKGEGVRRLRERLRIEGWLGKPIGASGGVQAEQIPTSTTSAAGSKPESAEDAKASAAIFDQELLDAVKLYYRSHQLEWGKTPNRIFWKSLNLSAKTRLKQVELNLKRWRESRYEGEENYILVNLPQFESHMIRAGKVEQKFRVVIGKNNRKCDPESARWVYPNATPSLSSQLEYFILNPSWYVPERIVEEEIKPMAQKDETWLKRKNYEIIKKNKKTDKWVVRQLPGPQNALGVAKFIFPNRHNTYMHDTPKKQYFKESIRSFSHGCMRVENPVDLATYLVKTDGQNVEELEFDALLKEGRSKMVKLKTPWPIFVEYYTVRADEEGWPQFFIDIYRRDARDTGPSPGKYGKCYVPKEKPEQESKPSDDVGP